MICNPFPILLDYLRSSSILFEQVLIAHIFLPRIWQHPLQPYICMVIQCTCSYGNYFCHWMLLIVNYTNQFKYLYFPDVGDYKHALTQDEEGFDMMKTIIIAVCSAGAYLALVIGLTAFCSYRLLVQRRNRKAMGTLFYVWIRSTIHISWSYTTGKMQPSPW